MLTSVNVASMVMVRRWPSGGPFHALLKGEAFDGGESAAVVADLPFEAFAGGGGEARASATADSGSGSGMPWACRR
jgi:hypothetical protein